jgi:hypothetical protein
MRPLPAAPIFDRDDARALGWSDSAITRAIKSGRLVALRRGQLTAATRGPGPASAVTDAGRWLERDREHILQARAAARARRDSVVSHQSAALIHGLPLFGRASAIPTLTVAPRTADGTLNAHIYRATLPPDEIVERDGVIVTSVARTLIDLGRSQSTTTAVVALDAALHLQATTHDELDAVIRRCGSWPRIRRAMTAVRLADARAESPLESVSRLVIQRLRIPAPILQPAICSRAGSFIGRVDFYWDEYGVVGEADGFGKYDLSPTSLLDEKRRQELLEDRAVVVTRWWWDVVRRPGELRRRLHKAFERGATRTRSGLPREWSVRSPVSGHQRWKPDQSGLSG